MAGKLSLLCLSLVLIAPAGGRLTAQDAKAVLQAHVDGMLIAYLPKEKIVIEADIGGLAAHAHHSIATVYDSSRQVTIDAIVAQFHLVNPHPFLLVDVKDGTGSAKRWRLEMDNRYELAAVGVTAQTLNPGDRVVVTGSLSRTQPQNLYIRRLDRPADGFWYEQVGASPKIGTPSR